MPLWFELALVVALGLVFGSFVTLVSWRLPRGEPVSATRSRCPKCKTTLGIPALVPFFSWALQRGRCRYCKAPVPWRYPLTELAQVALFLAVYAVYGVSAQAAFLALLSICLLILIVVDFEWYIIPDEIQIAMLALGLVYPAVADIAYASALASGLMGLAIGLTLRFGYGWVMKKEGLGWGDVKFLPIIGLWLADVNAWPPFLFYAGVWGVVTALVWRALGRGERFPFGPALAAALLMSLLSPATPLFYWTLGRLYG